MMIDYKEINSLSKILDYRAAKTEVISSNIANIDTPGYKAKEFDFEKILNQTENSLNLKTTKDQHIKINDDSDINSLVQESDRESRADGNNVDLDKEMLELNKNSINYNLTAHFVKKKFNKIKETIEKSGI